MIRPLKEKQWGNKANNLTATAATQKQAWSMLLVESDLRELDKPTFEDVYEIEAKP
jgi:hypothetical protein